MRRKYQMPLARSRAMATMLSQVAPILAFRPTGFDDQFMFHEFVNGLDLST